MDSAWQTTFLLNAVSIPMPFTLLPQLALAIHGAYLAAVGAQVSNSRTKFSRTGKLVLILICGYG